MAQVTGYELREAVKTWTLAHAAIESQFTSSLKAFPDDKKMSPTAIVEKTMEAEAAIAHLQTAQAHYNLAIDVPFEGRTIKLQEAVKLVGSAGRLEKMWRTAAGKEERRYSSYSDDERDATKTYAVRTISHEDALTLAKKAARRAGRLRAAIAEANAKRIDIPFLEAKYLKDD